MGKRRQQTKEEKHRYELRLARSRLTKAIRDRNTRNSFLNTYTAELERLRGQIESINKTAGEYEMASPREDDYIRKQKGIINQIEIILKAQKEISELRREGRKHV